MTHQKVNERFAQNLFLFSRFLSCDLELIPDACACDLATGDEKDILPFLEKKISSIAIYGINFAHYKALKSWLKASTSHQLVFLEDQIGAIKTFLNDKQAEEMLCHLQVSFAFLSKKNEENNRSILAQLTNDFYFLYGVQYKEKAPQVYGKLLQDVYAIQAYMAKLFFYKNEAHFYYHLATLNDYKGASDLKKTFPKLPFIICGAGPSLEETLDQLNESKKYAVLMAAGTAMNILNHAGIEADLGVAFDFHKSGARRLQSNSAFQTPFIVDLDSTAQGARYLHGPRVFALTDAAFWKIEWLKKLHIENEVIFLDPPITSTHFALEAAIYLKSSLQMLLGIDLAYIKELHYAGKKTWLQDNDDLTELKLRKDLIEVDQKLVSRTYNKEAFIYSYIAQIHPEIDFSYGSIKGMGVHGMKTITLQDWLKSFSKPIYKNITQNFHQLVNLSVPLEYLKSLLFAKKQELRGKIDFFTHPIFEPYLKRLELKCALKRKFCKTMKQDASWIDHEIHQFLIKVLQVHLEGIDEALLEIEDRIQFRKSQEVIKDKIPYIDGKIQGQVELYYDNGQLKMSAEYYKGMRHGLYRFYLRSGLLVEEGRYLHGAPALGYKEWNRNGVLETEIDPTGTQFAHALDHLKKSFEGLF